jgi:hypothetical protein
LVALAASTLAALVPLWATTFPPMVDVPQHAAQIAIWKALGDPSSGYAEVFELNWFTPYLLGYSIARAFAEFFSGAVPIKLAVSLAIVALPWATLALVRAAGGEPRVAILAAPLTYGFCFYWGFLNYLFAVPLGALMLAAAYRYRDRQTPGRGLALAGAGVLLFFGHILALGVAGLGALVLLVTRVRRAGDLPRLIAPLLAPVPLMVAWVVAQLRTQGDALQATEWGALVWRPVELLGLLLGAPRDPLNVAVLVLTGAALAIVGVRVRARLSLALPFLVVVVAFLVFPLFGFGVAMLYQRFAVFAAVLALPLLRIAPGRRAGMVTAVACAFAIGWSGYLTARFVAFDGEMAGMRALIERMEPGSTVRLLPVSIRSRHLPEDFPLFMHAPAWYQVEKGGHLSFSFAQHYPELVRYETTPAWAVPLGEETHFRGFRWPREVGRYDYFVVSARVDMTPRLFPGAEGRVRLVAREGLFWLYETVSP